MSLITLMVVELLTEFCPPRARPVINIKKEIKITPKEVDLTKKNCGDSVWYVCPHRFMHFIRCF